MYYAWPTAATFGNGHPPEMKSTSFDKLIKRMKGVQAYNGRFFIALMLDGGWADLFTFGPGIDPQGKEVSEERTARYIRARNRALEEEGWSEVTGSTPLKREDPEEQESPAEPQPTGQEPPVDLHAMVSGENAQRQSERQQVVLSVDPKVVKAIYEFLDLPEDARNKAINALSALSVSSEPFKGAVAVMLDETADLVTEVSSPTENTES